jgi:hypothetical protein
MRLTALVVLLTVVVCGSALADRKAHLPSSPTDVMSMAVPYLDLQGTPVYSWGPDGCWQGFGFDLNTTIIRPLMYPFVQSHGGVVTQDMRQARISAEWGFVCFDPRLTGANLGYQSWSRERGIHFTNEKFAVQVTVNLCECAVEPLDPSDPTSELRIVPGRVIATYVGVAKTNAVVDWGAFVNTFGWARGLNLGVGQTETSDCRLQLDALTKAVRALKPVTQPLY